MMIELDNNRFTHHNRNLYTPIKKRIDVDLCFPLEEGRDSEKPKQLSSLIEVFLFLCA